MRARLRKLSCVAPALLLGGCSGWQSALDPHGPNAESLAFLFWWFTAICGAVWLLVVIATGIAVMRARALSAHRADPLALNPPAERRAALVIGASVAATVLILIGFTASSYLVTKSFGLGGDDALNVKVIGHQWWWEIEYQDAQPSRSFTTANELHVPVGRAVHVRLVGADVIHSFWVPNLAGKQDLIPGRDNEIVFRVANAGVYRGQCAEFCGLQHAHMGMLVVAEAPAEFETWRNAQIASAAPPSDAERQRGLQVFQSKTCFACHAVRGTPAAGHTGPDLTHVGSRRSIAADTLPTSRGSLAAWIADPQQIKPGAQMPRVDLSPDELDVLAAYLDGLK